MIRAPLTWIRARLGRFRGDEAGTSTIEFVIVFPVFAFLLCSAAESGILMLRQVMLDRAVDLAVRDLRLQSFPDVTHDQVKTRICDEATVIPDCTNAVLVEMRQVDKGATLPSTNAPCVDRAASAQSATTFTQGKDNQMMLIRACAVFDPLFPGSGLGLDLAKDATGAYALISTSAFVVEPS
ncbi:TadE/TadG family type IV pilus assembly protein [Frigidibacter sp.]|uniref:TadE/TadG family type IV pilus assembly protein n=1 Tax=Frigidibacter sp. TaxID=2586418 RepID=UPI0027368567|nr:TadE/TadG family type IV pilus assembly protein [Frigidibacter sp.]MDP3342578.1 TadE/TadG family type IV pilus assembly protein [Frigidibacter sp.]